MRFLTLLILIQPLTALASTNYVGQYAKYMTTSHAANNSAETLVGTSEMQVIAVDPETQKYEIQITNQNSKSETNVTTALYPANELDAQVRGSLYHSCTDNYGKLDQNILVKGVSYATCKIQSSNTVFFVGVVPFSVIQSISTASDGTVFTTTLIDF